MGVAPIDGAMCRSARSVTECRLTTQMENQASYMPGYLLFSVLVKGAETPGSQLDYYNERLNQGNFY